MDEQLHAAVVAGDLGKVENLLKNGASINHLHGMRGTPLCAAIAASQEEMVDLLIKIEKCDINAKDFDGEPPLCLAIRKDLEHIVKKILNSPSCNVNKVDPVTGRPPISVAIIANNVNTVKLLLKKGCQVNKTDSSGNLPIHYAITDGKIRMVKLLLEYGSSIEKTNNNGHNALHHSIFRQELEIVKLLQKHAVDNNMENIFDKCTKMNDPCLHLAVDTENIPLIEYVISQQSDIDRIKDGYECHTALSKAVKNNSTEVVSTLLKYGACPNKENQQKSYLHYGPKPDQTDIFIAINNGNLEVVKLLVEYNANVNAKDSRGETPLAFALHRSKNEIAKFLLNETKTDIFSKNKNNEDALFAAISCSEAAYFVKELVRRGCDLNARNSDLLTALQMSVNFECLEVAEILLENGADPNDSIVGSVYPIHVAVSEGNIDMLRLLLLYGADINTVNDMEFTALDWALSQQADQPDITAFLIKNGASARKCHILKVIFGQNMTSSDVKNVYEVLKTRQNEEGEFETDEEGEMWDFLECAEEYGIDYLNYICELLGTSLEPMSLQLVCAKTINRYFTQNQIKINLMKSLHLPTKFEDMLYLKNM